MKSNLNDQLHPFKYTRPRRYSLYTRGRTAHVDRTRLMIDKIDLCKETIKLIIHRCMQEP